MAFCLHNDRSSCIHRIAGHLLARQAGLGSVSLHDLQELLGVCWRYR